MKRGDTVRVTGGPAPFAGRIIGLSQTMMVVAMPASGSVLLKRDIASTRPDRWQLNGMPVTVAVRQEGFRERLDELESRTRFHPEGD